EARALRGRLGRFWLWKPVALLSLVAAGMASSAVVALLLAGQLLTWRRLRALDRPELLRLGRARSAAARGGILLSAAAAGGDSAGLVPGAGFAMALLGCVGFVSSLLPFDLLRRELAGVLATAVCVGGFTVSGAAATPAGASAAQQQAIVHNLAAVLLASLLHS